MLTVSASDARLLADATNPFVAAGRRIPGLARPTAFETAWVNVGAPSEERPE